MYNTVVIRLSG